MPALPPSDHRIVAADAHRVPAPFRTLAVRSDERRHAHDARAPYGRVHLLRPPLLDAPALAALVADGFARVTLAEFSDIDYAPTSPRALAAAAPTAPDLVARLGDALCRTGVLGPAPAPYRDSVEGRVDYLATMGAGFHNDVANHWTRCLFWLLALAADDVEFVMPHAGVRLPVAPGDLLVFDPAMAHGLCRPADAGRAIADSFPAGAGSRQLFLTGELLLGDEQWAALGAPWRPVAEHDRAGALDLMAAEFDDRTGAVKRPRALQDGMKPQTCHVDDAGDDPGHDAAAR